MAAVFYTSELWMDLWETSSENVTEKSLKRGQVCVSKAGPMLGDAKENTRQAYKVRLCSMVGHPSCSGHHSILTSCVYLSKAAW